jgi:hypothetical protein
MMAFISGQKPIEIIEPQGGILTFPSAAETLRQQTTKQRKVSATLQYAITGSER